MGRFGNVCMIVSAAAILLAGSLSNTAWSQDHYCGVYSAYAVLDHYQRTLPFESLLEPEYVSGFEGSTAGEVVQALVDHGVAAANYSGLGTFDLRTASGPLILHVRGNQGTRRYQHLVVYLGEQDGQAVILDPSRGQSVMDYSRLLSLWDGIGIASADSTGELQLWRTLGIGKRWAILVVLGCLLVPVVQVLDRWTPQNSILGRRGQPLVRAVLLVGICSVVAIGMDWSNQDGFLRSPEARGSIASVHGSREVPAIGLQQAVALHNGNDSSVIKQEPVTVWIDARFQRDYEYGHIPGAFNLPIDATFAQEDALVEKLPPGAKVVVYCQSEGCAFADAVSERLRGHGFQDIQLFRPGYYEWEQSGAAVDRSKNSSTALKSEAVKPTSLEGGSD